MDSEDNSTPLQKERARWERVAAIVLTGTRRDLDVSQRELASRLGWTRNMVANLESGRRSLHVTDLIFIGRALNVGPEILLQRILRWGPSQRADSRRFSS
jgi:transcriptional regulator with XRE-family HTH domain